MGGCIKRLLSPLPPFPFCPLPSPLPPSCSPKTTKMNAYSILDVWLFFSIFSRLSRPAGLFLEEKMTLSRRRERRSDALTTTRAALRRSRASVSDFFFGSGRFLDDFQERSRPAGMFLSEKMSLSRERERLGDAVTTARALFFFTGTVFTAFAARRNP